MKKLLLLMSLSLVLFSFRYQSGIDAVVNALKKADAEQFSSYFDNLLDLKLPEKEEIKNISKTQASITLKNFFDQNNITGFELNSSVTRELNGAQYIAGKLLSANKTYNLTVMLKNRGDKLSIITVRIN